MASAKNSKFVIYAALAGNFLVAVTKFAAAWITGSSAMFSEGTHSLVDTGNQLLLLYGIHRASLPADDDHPLGYGRELYFWSFIVALLIFSLGAGVSLYEGVKHIAEPVEIGNPIVNYVVLGLALVFEGVTWLIAKREFDQQRGELGYFEATAQSKDPTTFIVLFEDSAAMIGIIVAFLGVAGSHYLNMPWLDGAASIGIGVLLAATAVFLARESKGLLLGEPASRQVSASLRQIISNTDGVMSIGEFITVHLAPHEIVLSAEADFLNSLTAADVETRICEIESRIRAAHPDVVAVFIKPVSM